MELYNKAQLIRVQKHWGYRRVAKLLNLRRDTVGSWFYKGNNPSNYRKHMPKLSASPELSYVIGTIFGDGYIYKQKTKDKEPKRRICLKVKDYDFLVEFNKNLCKVLGKVTLYKITPTERGMFKITGTSKLLYNFLKKGWENLKETIVAFPSQFIRGFADSEGSVYVSENSSNIRLFNTDIELLRYIGELLRENYGINAIIRPSIFAGEVTSILNGRQVIARKTLHMLDIAKKHDLVMFRRNIGFSIKRKQTTLDKLEKKE